MLDSKHVTRILSILTTACEVGAITSPEEKIEAQKLVPGHTAKKQQDQNQNPASRLVCVTGSACLSRLS